MTDEEAKQQATVAATGGRLVEAGWIMMVLKGAPEGLSENQIAVVRGSFYAGAKHILTLMSKAQQQDLSDQMMQKMVDDLQAEFGQFETEMRRKSAH